MIVVWTIIAALALTSQCMAVQPLTTDDTATVPPGAMEYEQAVEISEGGGTSGTTTTLTFGLTDNLDSSIAIGYEWTGESTGFTYPELQFKWKFARESKYPALAVFASRVMDFRGNADTMALLLAEKQVGSAIFLANLGYTWTGAKDDCDHFDWAAAFILPVSEQLSLTAEATVHDRINDILGLPNELEYLVGAMYSTTPTTCYAAGIGYRPNDAESRLRLTAGVTLGF